MMQDDRTPEITVIIPTFNRMDSLPQTLAALEAQDWDKNRFEVLVIDDGSGDGTHEFLQQFKGQTTLRFHYHEQQKRGPAAARNWGIENSRGRWLLFLDADIWAQKSLVRQHWQRHQTEQTARCWLGRIDPSPQLDRWQQYRWNEFAVAEGDGPLEWPWSRYRTPNSSFLKDPLREIGGFDGAFQIAEDTELAFRMARRGLRFFYDPDILAVHHHPISLTQYLDKARRYGRDAAEFKRKHPRDHIELALLFGLYDRHLSVGKKVRHGIKFLTINRVTAPALVKLGVALHKRKMKCAPAILTWVYRYHVRKAFQGA